MSERGEPLIDPVHWHWVFLAFNGEKAENIPIHWPATVEIAGYLTEGDAEIAASYIVQRDHYVLQRVWECRTCALNVRNSASMETLAARTDAD